MNAPDPVKLVEDLTLASPGTAWGGWAWWPAVLIAGAVVAAAFLFRRRAAGARARGIPPWRTALNDLEALRAQLDGLDARAFALRVSRILRVYIEGRFALRAPARSTEEFLAEASRSSRLAPPEREFVGAFLRHCDGVKFALAGLEFGAKAALHEEARRFVVGTAPASPQPPGSAGQPT